MPAWVDGILAALVPLRCVLCRARSDGLGFCTPCLLDLPWLELPWPRLAAAVPALQRLAAPSAATSVAALPARHPQPPGAPTAPRLVCAALRYQYPVDQLLAALKYGRNSACARPLGDALALALAELAHVQLLMRPDVLVPVPLHPRREAQRGFNQAALLATVVARQQGLTLAPGLLRRTRDTPPQATLGRAARVRNLRGAFVADSAVRGSAVALLDDVLTTGTTAQAAAAALYAAGAASVDVWCVARSLPG